MPLTCEIINPLDYSGWDDLLARSPGASFFHTSAWIRVLHESYGYSPAFFAQISGSRLHFLMPIMEVASFLTGRRGMALPFCDDCEPIVPHGTAVMDALPCIIDYGKTRRWKFLMLKQGAGSLDAHTPWQRYVVHRLALTPDIDRLFAGFKSTTKRNINKARKSSIEITMGNSPEDLNAYYQVHCLTRKRHGVPPQPFYFFRSIYTHVLANNQGLIIMARHHGTPVAGAVYFRFGERAYYKYGASDMRYQQLRAFNLVTASAIRHFAETGCSSFCFGRTEPDNEGLLQFKNGWNAEVLPLNYHKYTFKKNGFEVKKNDNNIFEINYNALLRTLPMGCLKCIGGLLYKHIP